jgi:hypothetical protein
VFVGGAFSGIGLTGADALEADSLGDQRLTACRFSAM